MHQAIHRHLVVITYMLSLGLMTAYVTLLQSIPSASAQLTTGSATQKTSGTDTHGQRNENIAPALPFLTKSLEKKDSGALTRMPHRLIRKPQSAPVASVEPSLTSSSPISSLPTSPPSLQNDNTISQSKELSSFPRSVGPTVPLATMPLAPTSATTSGATAAGTLSAGTIPLAAAGAGNSSSSGNESTGGRSMGKLAAEMPGLAQLMSPPSAPIPSTPPPSINPAIGASPTSLSFAATAGGANPAAQTLSISNTGGGTLNWSASDSVGWLTLSPASGTGNGMVTVSATTGSLTAGSHTSTVTLSGTSGVAPIIVPVSFTVAAAPVTITLSPTVLTFLGIQGAANPANQAVTVTSGGNWTASSSAGWLTVSPSSGSGNGSLTASVNLSSAAVGTNNATIMVSGGGVTRTTSVTLTVTAPSLIVSPSSLSYTATQGAANPANQSVTVSSNGSWTVSKNASWLSVSPTSGSSNGTIMSSVNTSNVAVGSQTATITVTSGGITRTVSVTLNLNAPTTSSATLNWTANMEPDLASYRIYRSTVQGVYGAAVGTVPQGTATYVASGLQVGNTYYFIITAVDSQGNESLRSNEVSKSIF